MDILKLVKQEHEKVEALFSEIENASDETKLYEIFNQIYTELTLHACAEELVFYPTLRDLEGTDDLIEEAEQEHAQARVLLEEIKSLSPNSVEFKEKLAQLKQAVQHHVQEEETEVFPTFRDSMNSEQLGELGEEFTQAKKKLQQDVQEAMSR